MPKDTEYLTIVENILNDSEFLKLKKYIHHGISRYDHSLKVSYKSYRLAKKKGLDYKAVAIGSLLHDFFDNSTDPSLKERFMSTFDHSKKAEYNAVTKFNVNQLEADIIGSHMFPVNLRVPQYKESWLVSMVDKRVSIIEFSNQFRYQISYGVNLFILLLMNSLK